MKYHIGVTVRPQISTVLEVEADGDIEAEEKAVNIILEDPRYATHDFNGEICEVLGDDVTIDSVEAMSCDHECDMHSINSTAPGLINVRCSVCGEQGTLPIDLGDVDWE